MLFYEFSFENILRFPRVICSYLDPLFHLIILLFYYMILLLLKKKKIFFYKSFKNKNLFKQIMM